MANYYYPKGGLPAQTERSADRAIFNEAFVFIPSQCFSDIVTSALPHWEKTRAWIIARPLSGFAETFAQYVMEVERGGGSTRPEPDEGAEAVLFVTSGKIELTINGEMHELGAGGYAYLAPATLWSLTATSIMPARFHWIRKRYEPADGIHLPESFVTSDKKTKPIAMPDTHGAWSTTRFVDPSDIRHDMHVNIVNFKPGGVIPFDETHVMEHGLYVLQGKAIYHLNGQWVEVQEGDFMWLRAYCPQSCYAAGHEPFRYLLYKDVNRHPSLVLK